MKFFKLSPLTFVLALAAALEAPAAPLTFYTYGISESLPCNSPNCADNANITLQGTITTDGLGTLAAKDVVVWDLAITPSGQAPIRLTQNNGQFSTFGSPRILATTTDLIITRNTALDGFTLGGSINAPANWIYGAPPSAEVLFYDTSKGEQYNAQQMLSIPSTFTAAAVSVAETPEPATLLLIVIASFVVLVVRGYNLQKSDRQANRRV